MNRKKFMAAVSQAVRSMSGVENEKTIVQLYQEFTKVIREELKIVERNKTLSISKKIAGSAKTKGGVKSKSVNKS